MFYGEASFRKALLSTSASSEAERSSLELSVLSESHTMRYPRAWLDSIRLRKALQDYPPYAPPHRGDCMSLSQEEGEENYAYFLDQKPARLERFVRLLAKFDVPASLDDAGLRCINEWVHRYGGHLVARDTASSHETFVSFSPSWTEANLPLNVIWDLAIYAGEYITSANPSHRWGLDLGAEHRISRQDFGYLRPCLFIDWHPVRRNHIFDFAFATARAKRRVATIGALLAGDPNAPADSFKKTLMFWAGSDPRLSRPRGTIRVGE
jgi:hypothetical protein